MAFFDCHFFSDALALSVSAYVLIPQKGSAELSLHCDFGEDGERQWAHRMGSYDLS